MKPHTIRPGRDYTTGGRDFAIIDAKGRIIGEAFDFVGPGERADAEGNARLFAHSAVVLAALEDICNARTEYECAEAMNDARPVILAAKGGAPCKS